MNTTIAEKWKDEGQTIHQFELKLLKNDAKGHTLLMNANIVFRMYLMKSVWTSKRRSAYIHVGVRLVLRSPWEAYHKNHNSAGFLAEI
jgi:hypothetical protein